MASEGYMEGWLFNAIKSFSEPRVGETQAQHDQRLVAWQEEMATILSTSSATFRKIKEASLANAGIELGFADTIALKFVGDIYIESCRDETATEELTIFRNILTRSGSAAQAKTGFSLTPQETEVVVYFQVRSEMGMSETSPTLRYNLWRGVHDAKKCDGTYWLTGKIDPSIDHGVGLASSTSQRHSALEALKDSEGGHELMRFVENELSCLVACREKLNSALEVQETYRMSPTEAFLVSEARETYQSKHPKNRRKDRRNVANQVVTEVSDLLSKAIKDNSYVTFGRQQIFSLLQDCKGIPKIKMCDDASGTQQEVLNQVDVPAQHPLRRRLKDLEDILAKKDTEIETQSQRIQKLEKTSRANNKSLADTKKELQDMTKLANDRREYYKAYKRNATIEQLVDQVGDLQGQLDDGDREKKQLQDKLAATDAEVIVLKNEKCVGETASTSEMAATTERADDELATAKTELQNLKEEHAATEQSFQDSRDELEKVDAEIKKKSATMSRADLLASQASQMASQASDMYKSLLD